MKSRADVPVLGILGGVASGKSTVAGLLARRGAAVVDADAIAHQVLALRGIKDALREEFGERILDGSGEVSRQKLGAEAFSDPDRLERLNRLVHPVIIRRMRRRLQELETQNVPLVAVDAALLVEKGLDRRFCDALLFVDADPETRAARAAEARGWSRQAMERRERAQMPPGEKRDRADYVVDNSGSLEELERSVDRVWKSLVGPAPERQDAGHCENAGT